jgi:hypothetical protein
MYLNEGNEGTGQGTRKENGQIKAHPRLFATKGKQHNNILGSAKEEENAGKSAMGRGALLNSLGYEKNGLHRFHI